MSGYSYTVWNFVYYMNENFNVLFQTVYSVRSDIQHTYLFILHEVVSVIFEDDEVVLAG